MNLVSTATTIMCILIEAIQFAYMASLMWRERNNVASRNIQRIRTAFASA